MFFITKILVVLLFQICGKIVAYFAGAFYQTQVSYFWRATTPMPSFLFTYILPHIVNVRENTIKLPVDIVVPAFVAWSLRSMKCKVFYFSSHWTYQKWTSSNFYFVPFFLSSFGRKIFLPDQLQYCKYLSSMKATYLIYLSMLIQCQAWFGRKVIKDLPPELG